ncbi:outer membrane protein [Notoacmeibacter ruber]|uniref:Porin family protein n=1 Tax=Notoacmeibacter ruber TaxID=2670375 RepID=A0A3L7JA83_9HYPH|nr:outer membrane protein [Notoacmeibacter ruber]RLQ87658.1 porin family protein [Notoacmeibacter ruber]
MKKIVFSALSGVSLLAAAGVAQAADAIDQIPEAPVVTAQPAPVLGWDGGYVGAMGNYNHSNADGDDLPGVDTDTFGGAAFAGYQRQNGNIVYGAEADIGYNAVNGDEDGVDVETGVDGSLRARLGYAPNDRVLVYGTGGVAAADAEVSAAGDSDSQTMIGYTVGAGADVKVTEQIFARGEYRYTDYMDESFDVGAGDQDVEIDNHRVGAGIGFKF